MKRHSFREVTDAYEKRRRFESRCSLCGLLEVWSWTESGARRLSYITTYGYIFDSLEKPTCVEYPDPSSKAESETPK